ncbi:heme peroxidase [Daedaleopsis nitida]|nr:heme peroxidase [Daedaleopsis nitida]
MTFKAFLSIVAIVAIVAIIQGASAAFTRRPDGKHTVTNAACCALFLIRDDIIANLFHNQCAEEAHKFLRLTFHDWQSNSGGGADGSIIIFSEQETNFHANLGTDEIVALQKPIWSPPTISRLPTCMSPCLAGCNFALPLILDHSIQFAGAPRVDFLSAARTPPALRPTTWSPSPSFFIEMQLRGQTFPGQSGVHGTVTSPLRGEMRLQSDHLLARNWRTACEWQSFTRTNDQEKFAETFPDVFNRLAVLGVDPNSLVDCS